MAIPSDAYLLIVGAMKSGTTTLFDFLAAHPQIAASKTKEPAFFCHDAGGRDAYEKLWDFNVETTRYAMEASTSYTKYPVVAGVPLRIHEMGIKPRFIYIMRDPLERIESHFNFSRNVLLSGESRLGDEQHVAISLYHMQLSQFMPYFDASAFLLLQFEELKNPHNLARKIGDFLKIDAGGFPDRMPWNNSALDGIIWKNRTYRQLHAKSQLFRAARKLTPRAFRLLIRKQLDKITRRTSTRFTPEERHRIREELREDMQRLSVDFGVDTKGWGF